MHANLVFGNPTEPCCGMGICDMQSAKIPSRCQISVDVSTSAAGGPPNLVITVSPAQMATLVNTMPDIYFALDNNTFMPDKTATPFYIDAKLAMALWHTPADPQAYVAAGNWMVTGSAQQGVTITIPQVSFGQAGGDVAQILPNPQNLQIGQWSIGVDAYGNLCIQSPNNSIIFGLNGHMSINHDTVITDNSAIWISNPNLNGAALNGTNDGALMDPNNPGQVYNAYPLAAATFWQAGDPQQNYPDAGANLTLHMGNPF